MAYMQSNLAFARGIQELSLEEIGFVSGGFGDGFSDGTDFTSLWDDALLGGQRDRRINWWKVLDQAVGGAVSGAAGGAVAGCVVGATTTAGPGCLPAAGAGAVAGAVGGAVTGAAMELWNQTAPPRMR